MKIKIAITFAILALLLFCYHVLEPPPMVELDCTLFSAVGSRVGGNGSLIAKNRDEIPDHYQEVRRVVNTGGYKFVGLYAIENDKATLKAGVNEHGLVIVSATASTIPLDIRKSDEPSLSMKTVLVRFKTVDEVLAQVDGFKNACFYMVADKNKIAYIEVAPENNVMAISTSEGYMGHTNHYLLLGKFNYSYKKVSASSKIRLSRINRLLKEYNKPLTIDAFYDFCLDHNAGPDNSIFRTGKTKTLAHFIVYQNDNLKLLFIKMYNDVETTVIYELDNSFWM